MENKVIFIKLKAHICQTIKFLKIPTRISSAIKANATIIISLVTVIQAFLAS